MCTQVQQKKSTGKEQLGRHCWDGRGGSPCKCSFLCSDDCSGLVVLINRHCKHQRVHIAGLRNVHNINPLQGQMRTSTHASICTRTRGRLFLLVHATLHRMTFLGCDSRILIAQHDPFVELDHLYTSSSSRYRAYEHCLLRHPIWCRTSAAVIKIIHRHVRCTNVLPSQCSIISAVPHHVQMSQLETISFTSQAACSCTDRCACQPWTLPL